MSPHEGAGLFLRDKDHLPEEHPLDWVSVAVRTRGRRTNRGRQWYADRQALDLSCWDWFPDVDDPAGPGLAEAVEFAASVGARSFILNAEKDFRGRKAAALLYASSARAHCQRLGLSLGLVSYSVPSTVRNFPWLEFARFCDFGIPEVYDREGAFDPRYPRRAIDSWRAAGFRCIVPACGIYQRDNGGPFRWRTPEEVRHHLALFPEHTARIAWGLKGSAPRGTLEALS